MTKHIMDIRKNTDFIGYIDNYFVKNKLYFYLVCFILLFLRRPMEFIEPYVWVEDGTWNIPHYLNLGASLFFEPVQGYLVLPPKVINFIALKLSFAYYPEISLALSVIFSLFCLGTIAFSPTGLKYKVLCAIAVLLIPTDPEVFVLPQYSFWWGTFLIIISVLWHQKNTLSKHRLFLTVIGGLSSPIVVLLLPLFLFRAYLYRIKAEVVCVLLVLLLSLIQGYYVIKYAQTTSIGISDIVIHAPDILNKYIGQYLIRHLPTTIGAMLGLFVLLFTGFICLSHRKKLNIDFFILVGLLALCIFSSIKRNPIEIIDPYYAGPRYFFFAYSVLSWIFLWLIFAVKSERWVYFSLIFFISVSVLNATSKFSRRGESPDWRAEVRACLSNESYNIPISFDGKLENSWFLTLSNADCYNLAKNSALDQRWIEYNSPIYKNVPISFLQKEPLNLHNVDLKVLSGSWQRAQFPIVLEVDSSHFLSSWVGSDMATGEQRLEFIADFDETSISYITGPIAVRQIIRIMKKDTLEPLFQTSFKKSEKLGFLSFPTEIGEIYEIQLSDNGNRWGEWSAIRVHN